MMKLIKISILWLAVSSYSLSCCCERNPQDYLNIKGKSYYKDVDIQWMAERIDSGKMGDDVDSLAANLVEAVKLIDEVSSKGLWNMEKDTTGMTEYNPLRYDNLRYALTYLSQLSHQHENHMLCTYLDARFFVTVADLRFGGVKSFIRGSEQPKGSLLFDYMELYGTDYFRQCLDKLDEGFQTALKGLEPESEAYFNNLVRKIFAKEEIYDEADLEKRAEQLDLIEEKLNGLKFRELNKEILLSDEERKQRASSKLRRSRLMQTTSNVRILADVYDIYNLARLLLPEETATKVKRSVRFDKLNEYSRLSQQFQQLISRYDASLKTASTKIKNGVLFAKTPY